MSVYGSMGEHFERKADDFSPDSLLGQPIVSEPLKFELLRGALNASKSAGAGFHSLVRSHRWNRRGGPWRPVLIVEQLTTPWRSLIDLQSGSENPSLELCVAFRALRCRSQTSDFWRQKSSFTLYCLPEQSSRGSPLNAWFWNRGFHSKTISTASKWVSAE